MPVTEENIYRWLSHPQEIKPGSKMPILFLATTPLKPFPITLASSNNND
jgi:hypothetical protein